jgi:hypothetical protein
MFEFRVPLEDHIELAQNPDILFSLAVGSRVFLIRGSEHKGIRPSHGFSLVALIEAKLGKDMGRKNGRSSDGSAAPAHTTKTDRSCRHGWKETQARKWAAGKGGDGIIRTRLRGP